MQCKKTKCIFKFLILISFISLIFCLKSYADEDPNDIIIIKRQNSYSFNQPAKGLINELTKKDISRDNIYEYDLVNNKIDDILENNNVEDIRVLFLIGNSTTQYITSDDRFDGILKVFMMVMNPVEKGIINSFNNPGSKIGGVTLDVATKDKMELLKLLIPDLKSIGVIYSNKTTDIVSDLTQDLRELGILLNTQFISSPDKVKEIFPQMAENIDLFMFLLDTNIFRKSIQNYFFEKADKYPICGLTSNHVKSGLLCSVSTDYYSQGKQAAHIFFRLEKDFISPVESPEMVKLYVNKDTADKLNIRIPHSPKIIVVK